MENKKLLEYLQKSSSIAVENHKEYLLNDNIQIYIKDHITNDINFSDVLNRLESTIPAHLMSEIDSIFVGVFEDFDDRSINAMYKDGAIYVSNEQDNIQDMLDDIVHEIAHSLETPYGGIIYGDQKIEKEFAAKRMQLYHILKSEELNPSLTLFKDLEYSSAMDEYLYQEVGYERLNFIAASYGLFASAYAATSLQEYFANGIEHFFLDDRSNLKECCPELYHKIEELYEL
tara:strand:+ start:656 stop:1348 length:693 start_codon:yes stop_codon:yes gene_type:complete